MSQPIRIPPRSTVPASASHRGPSASSFLSSAAYCLGPDHQHSSPVSHYNQRHSNLTSPYHPSYPHTYSQSLAAQHVPPSSIPCDDHLYTHNHRHHHDHHAPANTPASFATTYTDTVTHSNHCTTHKLFSAPELAFGDLDGMDPQELTSPEDVLTSSGSTYLASSLSALIDDGLDRELPDEYDQESRRDLRGALPSAPGRPQTSAAEGDIDEPFVPPHIIGDRLYAQEMCRSLNRKKIPKLSLSFLL